MKLFSFECCTTHPKFGFESSLDKNKCYMNTSDRYITKSMLHPIRSLSNQLKIQYSASK